VSIIKEIKSVAIDKAALLPVHLRTLSASQLKSIITSSLFLIEKFSADGSFEKLKARLVAGGHLQNRSEYDDADISSPTVSTISVMVNAAIAAKEQRRAKCLDVGTAYLNTRSSNHPDQIQIPVSECTRRTSVYLSRDATRF
jgi:hypothetical protein